MKQIHIRSYTIVSRPSETEGNRTLDIEVSGDDPEEVVAAYRVMLLKLFPSGEIKEKE